MVCFEHRWCAYVIMCVMEPPSTPLRPKIPPMRGQRAGGLAVDGNIVSGYEGARKRGIATHGDSVPLTAIATVPLTAITGNQMHQELTVAVACYPQSMMKCCRRIFAKMCLKPDPKMVCFTDPSFSLSPSALLRHTPPP